MSDFGRNKLIQTQLEEDIGQYSEKCFGANDKGTFDVINAEARRAKKTQRKEELQREDDGDCAEAENTGRCQFINCTTCGQDFRSPNKLTKAYLEKVVTALSASNRDDVSSQKFLSSVPLRREQRPTSTNLGDYLLAPVYIFSPHEGLPKGNLFMVLI
jgi:hypothetical protein